MSTIKIKSLKELAVDGNKNNMIIFNRTGLNKGNPEGNRRGRDGMVLVLTLWVLAVLSLLLLTLVMSINLTTKKTISLKSDAIAGAIGRGAVFAVTQDLLKLRVELKKDLKKEKNDEKSNKNNAVNTDNISIQLIQGDEMGFYLVDPDGWTVTKKTEMNDFPSNASWRYKTYAVCHVMPEDAKAPLNKFKKENWMRIPSVTEELTADIMKLMKNRDNKLSSVEELLTIKGIQGKLYDGDDSSPGFKNILTVVLNGKININHASPEAIAAALDIELKNAIPIAEAVKEKHYFVSMKDVEGVLKLDAQTLASTVSLASNVYRIKAYVIIHGHVKKMEAVVLFTPENLYKLIYMGEV